MQCLVKSHPEIKALLKKYTDILGSESAAYYVVSMNNGLPLDQAPDGTQSELYSALISSGMTEEEAVFAKSVIYTPLYVDKYGNWHENYDASNGSEEPSITTLQSDPVLVDHTAIKDILSNHQVVVERLANLELSNVVNSTPVVLSAVREERDAEAKQAVEDLLNNNPDATTEQIARVRQLAEADYDKRTLDKAITTIQTHLAEGFVDVHGNPLDGYTGSTKLGSMRATFLNSLSYRFANPGMSTVVQNTQHLISVHLLNSVLNNRDLSTTIPIIVEQYIRMFYDADFMQKLFQTIKDVHGNDLGPERLVKLSTDYVVGKLKRTEKQQKLNNFWFSVGQFFRELFRRKTSAENRQLQRNTLDALAVYFSCAQDLIRSTDKELNTIFYITRPKSQHVTIKNVVSRIRSGLVSRITALEKSQPAALLGNELEQIAELKKTIAQLDAIENLDKSRQDSARIVAMEQFVIKGLSETANAYQLIEQMKNMPIEQINAAQLDNIRHNVIGFYKNLIKEWVIKWAKEDTTGVASEGTSFMDAVDLIRGKMGIIEDEFDKLNLLYTQQMLQNKAEELVVGDKDRFIYNMVEWLQNKINGGHLSFFDRLLKGGFASDSPIIRIFDFALRQQNALTRNQVDTVGRRLGKSYKAAEEEFRKIMGPFSNYVKLLYERDEDGDYTGNLRSSINRGAFDKKIESKKKQLLEKYNAEVDENDGTITFNNGDDWRSYNDELDDYIEKIGGHRRYKADYYKTRRQYLSKTTIDKLDGINREIREIENKCIDNVDITLPNGKTRTIKAPLTYKLKPLDRERLVELRRQKEELSNPYVVVHDAYGKISKFIPKSGDDARIAQELINWKAYLRNSSGVAYSNNTQAYKLVREKLENEYSAKIGVATNPLTGQLYTDLDVQQLLNAFDYENSTTQLSQEYYEEINKIIGNNKNPIIAELNARKNAILRSCFNRRGYFEPNLDKLNDEAWAELKRIDEQIYKNRDTSKKLTKQDVEDLNAITNRLQVKKFGTSQSYYSWLYDQYVAAGKESEFNDKFTYTKTTKDGKKVITPLSAFSYSAPVNPMWVESPSGTGIFSEIDEESSLFVDQKYDPTKPEHIQVDEEMYRDREFEEILNDNPKIKDFYDDCLSVLDEMWAKLPSTYRKNRYRLPQQRDEFGSLFTRKHGAKTLWKAIIGESGVNETDLEYNEEFQLRPDGTYVETIPIRGVRDLDDKNMIKTDLISLLVDFTETACNFENKSIMQPLWELVGFQLKGGFAGRSEGVSDQSKRFDTHKSMYMYGRMRQGVNPGVKMGRVQQLISKSIYKMMGLAHSKLMVHKWPSVLRNWYSSGVTLYAEIASGRDFDISCFKEAVKRIGKDIPNTIKSIPLGRYNTRSETAAMMQANGISSSISEIFKDTNKWWVRRVLKNHGSMGEYNLVDYLYKGLITQMIYNSVRLIEDPQSGKPVFATKQQAQYYYTRAGYTAGDGKKAWRRGIAHVDDLGKTVYSRTTLADAFYVDEDGKYTLKPEFEDLVRPVINEETGRRTNKLETQVEGFIRERVSVINGILDTYDRNGMHTTFIGAAVLQMRGWAVAQQVDYNKDGHDFAVYDDDNTDMSKSALEKLYGRAMRSVYDSGVGLIRQEAADEYRGQYDFLAGGTRQGAWTVIPFIKAYSKLFQDWNLIKFALSDSMLDKIGAESSTLTDQQKYVIIRMNCTIFSVLTTSLLTFTTGKLIEDDPDNWVYWLLYTAATTAISETSAQLWFAGLVFTLTDIIKSPAVLTAYYQDFGYAVDALRDLAAMIYDDATGGNGNIEAYQQIKTGSYKGKEKWMRDVSRTTALIPGVSELGFDNLYRQGVFDGSVHGLRSTATWYYQVFPTNMLVYRPQVTTEKGQLRKAKDGELKPQRGIYGMVYNPKGTSFSEYFYDPNASVEQRLKQTFFGYIDNDSDAMNKNNSRKTNKAKTNKANSTVMNF